MKLSTMWCADLQGTCTQRAASPKTCYAVSGADLPLSEIFYPKSDNVSTFCHSQIIAGYLSVFVDTTELDIICSTLAWNSFAGNQFLV